MKQILTLFAFGSVGSAIAQPTLTFAGNGPTQGTSYEWHFSDHIAPGTAGPGQVWDFSSLTTDSTEVVTLVDPATTTFGAQFPTATVAEAQEEIIASLRARCFYVGALGSRKTHAKRVERLLAAGLTDEDVGRIDAPIGLDIGAQSPAEIAVAILGAIVQAFRKRELGR